MRNSNPVLNSLPDDARLALSRAERKDNFYALPRIVECFIQRANSELPRGWTAKPWTMNHSVSIFYRDEAHLTVHYEYIEDGLVACLDKMHQFVTRFKSTTLSKE